MHLSLASFLTFQLGNSIILISIFTMMRSLGDRKIFNHNILYILSILFIMRSLLPFEFFHTITIPSKFILPSLNRFLDIVLWRLNGNLEFTVLSALLFVWIFVAICKLFRFTRSYIQIKRFIRICGESDQFQYEDRSLRIYFVEANITPSVIGVASPMIVFPKNYFTEREKELILSHEAAHISNYDLYVKYIYSLISIIYWWNPLVYLFQIQINQILEIRADAFVMKKFTEELKYDYIETLIKASKLRLKDNYFQSNFSLNFSTKSSNFLFLRSKCILNGSKTLLSTKIVVGLIFLFFYFSSSIVFESYSVDSITESKTFEITSENSFFIEKDGKSELYVNNKYLMKFDENSIPKEFKNVEVRKSKE